MKNNIKKIIIFIIIILVIILIIEVIYIKIKKDKYQKYNVFDVSECKDKSCDKTLKFNDNTFNIKYDNNKFILYLNDKQIYTGGGTLEIDNYIYTFDDAVLVPLINGQIKILEFHRPKLSSINISKLLDDSMVLINYEVKGDSIIMIGSRFIDDDTFMYGISEDTIVKVDNCASFTKYKDKIVFGIYKMTYLGNNDFSQLERIETTTLENYGDFKKLCDN